MNKIQQEKLKLILDTNNKRINSYSWIQKAIFLKVEVAELFNELKIKPWHLKKGETIERDEKAILSEMADVMIFTIVGGMPIDKIEEKLSYEIPHLIHLEAAIQNVFKCTTDEIILMYNQALTLIRSIIDYSGAGNWDITLDDVLDATIEKTNFNAKRFGYSEIEINKI